MSAQVDTLTLSIALLPALQIADVPKIVATIREWAPRAKIVVDGVAYAPHRAIDVQVGGLTWV